jgi:hypothetical protein
LINWDLNLVVIVMTKKEMIHRMLVTSIHHFKIDHHKMDKS